MTSFLRLIQFPVNADLNPAAFEFGIKGRNIYDYTWIYALGIIFAFVTAAGSGANDVANSWATSVGSRTLKMWQAVVLAAIMEFSGAFILGARVVDFVRSNIVSPTLYTAHEDLLMLGMMQTLLWVGIWLFVASWAELNISTTHSIIGSIIGFALCTPSGGNAVQWNQVGIIVASWICAPILTGCLAATFFGLTRKFVLRHERAYERSFTVFPLVVFYTFFINTFFIMYSGGAATGKGLSRVSLSAPEGAGIAFGVGSVCALATYFVISPYFKRRIDAMTDAQILDHFNGPTMGESNIPTTDSKGAPQTAVVDPAAFADREKGADNASTSSHAVLESQGSYSTAYKESCLDRFFHQKYIHASVHQDKTVAEIHSSAERFPLRAEYSFGYLQVVTACFASFAHGSNDVANYIGPLAAIHSIYYGQPVAKKTGVEDWLLALGGGGLVIGLALYGHVIIAAMGVKMAIVTPARGYCIELSAATITVIGTFIAIPLSSSQGFIGAIVGVALMEGSSKSTNWKLLGKNVASWILTLILMGVVSAMLFSYVTFAPSQVYPLSKNNCLAFYAPSKRNNVTTDPNATYTLVPAGGQIRALYGYPTNGSVFAL